jgi:hypothetical protein
MSSDDEILDPGLRKENAFLDKVLYAFDGAVVLVVIALFWSLLS